MKQVWLQSCDCYHSGFAWSECAPSTVSKLETHRWVCHHPHFLGLPRVSPYVYLNSVTNKTKDPKVQNSERKGTNGVHLQIFWMGPCSQESVHHVPQRIWLAFFYFDCDEAPITQDTFFSLKIEGELHGSFCCEKKAVWHALFNIVAR